MSSYMTPERQQQRIALIEAEQITGVVMARLSPILQWVNHLLSISTIPIQGNRFSFLFYRLNCDVNVDVAIPCLGLPASSLFPWRCTTTARIARAIVDSPPPIF